jgi:hypothetical protein
MKSHVKILVLFVTASVFISAKVNAQNISDSELKKNAAPVNNSLDIVSQLKPVSFEFNADKFKNLNLPAGKQYGFLTDDVQQILPGLITKQQKWYTAGKNDQRAVTTSKIDYEMLIPLLVGAIQQQQAEIDALKAQLKAR